MKSIFSAPKKTSTGWVKKAQILGGYIIIEHDNHTNITEARYKPLNGLEIELDTTKDVLEWVGVFNQNNEVRNWSMADIKLMKNTVLSVRQLAEHFNVTEAAIRSVLNEHSISLKENRKKFCE